MITIGNFRENVFRASKRSCTCRDCTYRNIKCANPSSVYYLTGVVESDTCGFSKIKCDEIWLVVRSLKDMDYAEDIDMMHVSELSPTPTLYRKFLDWKSQGKWNEEVFQKEYIPEFLKDLKRPEAQEALNILLERSKTSDIMLACYCGNETICHRSIILGILQGMGAMSYNAADYSKYYGMYKALHNE